MTICRTCAAQALQLNALDEWRALPQFEAECVLSALLDHADSVRALVARKRAQGLNMIAEDAMPMLHALEIVCKLLKGLRDD